MTIASLASIFLIIGIIIYGLWRKANLYLLISVAIIMTYIFGVLTALVMPYVQTSEVFFDLAFAPAYLSTGTNLYTVVTTMFLHVGLFHLIFNLFGLIFIGGVLESRIGTYRFFGIFLITGIIGTLVHAAFYLGSYVPVVGASGAILGLLGALARLYPHVKFRLFGILPPMSAYILLALFLLIDTVLAFGNDTIAHLAHIGGAVSGFLIAPLIVRVERKKAPIKARVKGLEVLATTPELREILERVKEEDNEEVIDAWMERFYSRVSCPNCKSALRTRGKRIFCKNCGWKMKVDQ
jgi:membrane associated rhomboid family serine protease